MARWVFDGDSGALRPDLHCLGVLVGEQIAGHITLRVQPVLIPATEWSGGQAAPLPGPDGAPLSETFVQTFAVEAAHRRQGFGRALQLAALDLTRALGGYQMRSWSSLDKSANYALKLSLGFAAHPAVQVTSSGQAISGVYFVKTV